MDKTMYLIVAALILTAGVTAYVYTNRRSPQAEPPPTTSKENRISSTTISAADAQELIQKNNSNPDFIVLDVRTAEEHAALRIQDSPLLDFYSPDFSTKLAELDKSKTYLVYCRSGNRSGSTIKIMQELGFTNTYNLNGGIVSWEKASLPIVQNN